MSDDDRPEAAVHIERDEQQQQRQPGDHFWHHQRSVDHAGKQQPPAKPSHARQGDGRERAEHGCGGCRQEGDTEADPGGAEYRLVVQQLAIPYERPSTPDRDKPRGIERVDHQNDDRQVEKRKPQAH